MSHKFQKSLEPFLPFLLLGIAIAFGIAFFIIFTYILFWGLIIAGILWLVMFIKNYFSPKKRRPASKGRIIEHQDNERD